MIYIIVPKGWLVLDVSPIMNFRVKYEVKKRRRNDGPVCFLVDFGKTLLYILPSSISTSSWRPFSHRKNSIIEIISGWKSKLKDETKRKVASKTIIPVNITISIIKQWPFGIFPIQIINQLGSSKYVLPFTVVFVYLICDINFETLKKLVCVGKTRQI